MYYKNKKWTLFQKLGKNPIKVSFPYDELSAPNRNISFLIPHPPKNPEHICNMNFLYYLKIFNSAIEDKGKNRIDENQKKH